jgi:hypothetical protein
VFDHQSILIDEVEKYYFKDHLNDHEIHIHILHYHTLHVVLYTYMYLTDLQFYIEMLVELMNYSFALFDYSIQVDMIVFLH